MAQYRQLRHIIKFFSFFLNLILEKYKVKIEHYFIKFIVHALIECAKLVNKCLPGEPISSEMRCTTGRQMSINIYI